jgi:hypothetical protein
VLQSATANAIFPPLFDALHVRRVALGRITLDEFFPYFAEPFYG